MTTKVGGTAPAIRIYFSDFFQVDPQRLAEYGAFDVSLINDLPLFIDPFLLFNSEKTEYQALHGSILEYLRFLREKAAAGLSEGRKKSLFHFPEVKQNWLGYSESGNSGRGLGTQFASSLDKNLNVLFSDVSFSPNAGKHLEKLCLIKGGVGRDQISDFTTNLICGYLCEYTQIFAAQFVNPQQIKEFAVKHATFNYTTETWVTKRYRLPVIHGDFVLLTPKDMLTKDDTWISHKDLLNRMADIVSCVPNDQLRENINDYFLKVLPIEPNAAERNAARAKTLEKFPELLDVYIAEQEKRGNEASFESAERVSQANLLFVQQLKSLVERLCQTAFYDKPTTSYQDALARVHYLKTVIEDQDGYKIFYVKGKPIKREQDLQIMFKLTWMASGFDYNAEVNNGRGPADFSASYGRADKTIIEFKLAGSSSLERNLLNQAEIYAKAARATQAPIKVILYFSEAELSRVNLLLRKHELTGKEEIVLIDASADKASASKAH